MSMFAQGSQLFFIDPDTKAVVKVDCPTGFNPGGAPADQLEDTCIDATTKTYKKGLRTPGQATVNLMADPKYASHIRLYELYSQDDDSEDNKDIQWAIGWSDGKNIFPTADSNGEFVFPTTRSWLPFEGYITDFPFDFQTNTLVATAMTIQRSGLAPWIPKVVVS